MLRELQVTNPDVLFFLENVRMKQEWRDRITDELGVEPYEINSNLVSAQNRWRQYWTNIEGVTTILGAISRLPLAIGGVGREFEVTE